MYPPMLDLINHEAQIQEWRISTDDFLKRFAPWIDLNLKGLAFWWLKNNKG
jgi:hypothetical protein